MYQPRNEERSTALKMVAIKYRIKKKSILSDPSRNLLISCSMMQSNALIWLMLIIKQNNILYSEKKNITKILFFKFQPQKKLQHLYFQ